MRDSLLEKLLSCRFPRVCAGQLGWWSVLVAAGRPARARVSARRSASGRRYRPAMRRTRSAASARGIPAAVTNRGGPRIRAGPAPRGRRCGTWTWPPRSPGCRTRHAHARPGRAGRRDPDRRSRRPPAGPARSGRPGPRAAAGARAGRTLPAGRAVPGVLPRCVRPVRGRSRHRRPGRLPPGRRRSSGSARPRRRTRRRLGTRRFPCPEDARTCARHQDHVLAAARAGAHSKQPSMSRSVIGLPRARARVTAVISSPISGVFAVTAAGPGLRRGHVIYSGVFAVAAVTAAGVPCLVDSLACPGEFR